MLVENATLPWGQSWERNFPQALVHTVHSTCACWKTLSQDCPHGEIRQSYCFTKLEKGTGKSFSEARNICEHVVYQNCSEGQNKNNNLCTQHVRQVF